MDTVLAPQTDHGDAVDGVSCSPHRSPAPTRVQASAGTGRDGRAGQERNGASKHLFLLQQPQHLAGPTAASTCQGCLSHWPHPDPWLPPPVLDGLSLGQRPCSWPALGTEDPRQTPSFCHSHRRAPGLGIRAEKPWQRPEAPGLGRPPRLPTAHIPVAPPVSAIFLIVCWSSQRSSENPSTSTSGCQME